MRREAVGRKQKFHEHVKELRRRLAWSAGVFVAGAAGGYIFRQQLMTVLQKPIGTQLYYNTPGGSLSLITQLCMLAGAFLALPVLVYNIVRFLEPAMKNSMRNRSVVLLAVLSVALGTLGLGFAYLVALPMALHFFQSFRMSGLQAMISANSYLDFVIRCLLTFILMFQIPLVILFVNRIKPLSPRKLLKYEKFVVAGSLVIALALPFTYDPITMFVIAAPIVFLYNFSLVLVWISNRTRKTTRRLVPAKTQSDGTTPISEVLAALGDVTPSASPSDMPRTGVAGPVDSAAAMSWSASPTTVTVQPAVTQAMPVESPVASRPARRQVRTFSAAPLRGGPIVDIGVAPGRRSQYITPARPAQDHHNFLDLRLADQETSM